jgi:hypothetical protein
VSAQYGVVGDRLWVRETWAKADDVTVPLAAEMTGIPWSDIPDLHTAWRLGWEHINGKRAPWSKNPWVWAVSFKRVQP